MKSKVSFICSFSMCLLCFILFPVIKFLLLVTAAGTAAKTVIEVITTFLCDFSNFTINVPVNFLPLLANKLDKKKSLSVHTSDSPIVNQPKQYFSLIYLFIYLFILWLSISLQGSYFSCLLFRPLRFYKEISDFMYGNNDFCFIKTYNYLLVY